ncbi:hypothetical protein BVX98_00785 [bacterium F11]|nr:hypothetical protein BVX98_00785 [bacterium F11]
MRRSFNSRFGFAHRLCLLLALPLISFSLAFSAGRKPIQPEESKKSVRYDWIYNGITKKVKAYPIEGHDYFRIGGLAKLSRAQLRWQSITKQACLSRVDGLLCFNWERSTVYHDGTPTNKKYKLIYRNQQLYIPVGFAPSKTFESFTQTKLALNEKQRILSQDSPVTLKLPPVENLGDRYCVKVEMEERTPYQVIEQNKKRVWLRFIRGRFSRSEIFRGDKVLKEVRVNQKHRSADLILKLGHKAKTSHLQFDPTHRKLIIDVFTKERGASVVSLPENKSSPSDNGAVSGTKKSSTRRVYKPLKDRKFRTIVIDPGHGGKDSGAVGVRGTVEKNINLKVGLALAKELKKNKNLRVILTRDNDSFTSLSDRTEVANNAKADLFVSIHCNSSFSSKSKGFEVYILSEEASDEAAEAVARKENSVVQLEARKGEASSKLYDLLASMAVYNFINQSSECAAHICRGVKKKSRVKSTAVREANFHVLRGAQMPGVLVELEYLSNPVTELKLRSSRYRSQLVRGLAAGVLEYDRRSRQKFQAVTAQKQKKQEP